MELTVYHLFCCGRQFQRIIPIYTGLINISRIDATTHTLPRFGGTFIALRRLAIKPVPSLLNVLSDCFHRQYIIQNQSDNISFLFVNFKSPAFIVSIRIRLYPYGALLATYFPSFTEAIRPRCKRRLIVLYSRRDINKPNSKYSSSNSLFGL